MTEKEIEFYTRLAHGLAVQFGPRCEVTVYDLEIKDPEHSIVAIENGDITGRKIGDGPSPDMIEAIHGRHGKLKDRLGCLTRSKDGKLLRSSSICIQNSRGKIAGILSISYDITLLLACRWEIAQLTNTQPGTGEQAPICMGVSDFLENLISQSIQLIGKPAALMTREEKLRAIRFLNDSGALLITRSGQRICEVFGFSKYTLYNYLEEIKQMDDPEGSSDSPFDAADDPAE